MPWRGKALSARPVAPRPRPTGHAPGATTTEHHRHHPTGSLGTLVVAAAPLAARRRCVAAAAPTSRRRAPRPTTTAAATGARRGARDDHDRLPDDPQRRPHREARGLAREGLRPTPTIEWKLFDSGGAVNEAVARRRRRHRPGRLAARSRAALSNGIAVPGAVDPRRHRRGRGAGREGRHRHHRLAGPRRARRSPRRSRRPSHYSLLAALEDAGVDADDVNIIDAEPDDIYAAWTHGDIDGAYVWNPNLRQDHRRGRQGAGHQRRPGREGQDHLRPRRRHQRLRRRSTRRRSRPGSSSRTGRSSCSQDDPDAAAEAIAAELNITAEEAPGPDRGPDLPRRADEQVGADYLGGGLGQNLFAAAEFNKELGQDRRRSSPRAAYVDAVNATLRRRRPAAKLDERSTASPGDRRHPAVAARATVSRALRRAAAAGRPPSTSIDLDDPTAGEFVAVVGPSGCGKTTLLS